uniref:Uncharacterized protein n=1 Tax=Cacopsylla melanoneura TaxID=428564 RepID=A0A8D9AND7_9HEMI
MLMNHLVLFESHWKTSIPKLSPKKTFNCQNSIPSTRLLCENEKQCQHTIELLHTQLHHLVLTGHLILLYLVLTVNAVSDVAISKTSLLENLHFSFILTILLFLFSCFILITFNYKYIAIMVNG